MKVFKKISECAAGNFIRTIGYSGIKNNFLKLNFPDIGYQLEKTERVIMFQHKS